MIQINDKVQINNISKTDLHMHTIYCDGKNTPEEMVLSAIEKGMECIGFSGHSYVKEDPTCGMSAEHAEAYYRAIQELKEKYADKITIYCGVEQDFLSTTGTDSYDYVIGSVHYIDTPDGPVAVDDTPELLKAAVEKYYDGDYYLAAENYFEQVSQVVEKTGADIIGHFDLIAKFNQKEKMFDEGHPRYEAAWKKALNTLILKEKVFEINTGGISRGWRDIAYPNPVMISYIRARGGKFIYSSDSHKTDTIGYQFGK